MTVTIIQIRYIGNLNGITTHPQPDNFNVFGQNSQFCRALCVIDETVRKKGNPIIPKPSEDISDFNPGIKICP